MMIYCAVSSPAIATYSYRKKREEIHLTLLKGEPWPPEGKVKMELTVIGSRVQF